MRHFKPLKSLVHLCFYFLLFATLDAAQAKDVLGQSPLPRQVEKNLCLNPSGAATERNPFSEVSHFQRRSDGYIEGYVLGSDKITKNIKITSSQPFTSIEEYLASTHACDNTYEQQLINNAFYDLSHTCSVKKMFQYSLNFHGGRSDDFKPDEKQVIKDAISVIKKELARFDLVSFDQQSFSVDLQKAQIIQRLRSCETALFIMEESRKIYGNSMGNRYLLLEKAPAPVKAWLQREIEYFDQSSGTGFKLRRVQMFPQKGLDGGPSK